MKKELYLFLSAVIISFLLHLLIIFKIYHPGNMVVMPLTIGMVFGWLYTSGIVKDQITNDNSSFTIVVQKIPPFLKYFLGFVILYAFFNFFSTFSMHTNNAWVDFSLNHNKLKGVSGFWILFYLIGFTGAYFKNYIFQPTSKKE